ncbi:MAG: hypothetical protein AABY63_07010, partial [candidate division NC10 bacterium]
IRPACAYTQASRSGEACCGVFAFSPVDLREARSKPAIRVAEYRLGIISGICFYGCGETCLRVRTGRQRSEVMLWVT